MAYIDPTRLLNAIYEDAMGRVGSGDKIVADVSENEARCLSIILGFAEQAKAVLTVVITSIVYKALNPAQDIRNHQSSIADGYSGRTFDSTYITPFLKAKKFPAMAESGWLTRSLEQKIPYDKNYSGAITPKGLKPVFLECLDRIESGADCAEFLSFIFQGLILQRNRQTIDLAKPTTLSINSILEVLNEHFNGKYTAEGASRLPVLALYAAYLCLTTEMKRFEGKQLLAIESHTSSDKSSGRIGDIDVIDEKKRAFEAVEIKHGIPISLSLVETAFEKFKTTPVDRYYILSTAGLEKSELDAIETEIHRIKNVHGCQLIVNGILPTLKYYLRLLQNPYEFIEHYVNLLEVDAALKFEHKVRWNDIIGRLK